MRNFFKALGAFALVFVGSLAGAQQVGLFDAGSVFGNASGSASRPAPVAPAVARSPLLLDIDQMRKPGDANITILSTDRTIAHTALTAARTDTLPLANSVNAGNRLLMADVFAVVTAVNTVSLTRAGADTINGAATAVILNTTRAISECVSDGVSAWLCSAPAGVTSVVIANGNGITLTGTCTIISTGTCTVTNSGFLRAVEQKFVVNGTYTPTTGMLYADVMCTGGGGGGGGVQGAVGSGYSGGGGGAGGTSRIVLTAAAVGASKAITIGAAGTAGASGGGTGGNGTDTSLGTLCVGKGGSGGFGNNAGSTLPQGGDGGVAGTGTVTGTGMPGFFGDYGAGTVDYNFMCNGGSSPFGGGGKSPIVGIGTAVAGNPGSGNGSGGACGAAATVAAGAAGGAGTVGIVYIKEFVTP